MSSMQVDQVAWLADLDQVPSDDQLRSWDWSAEAARQDRSNAWLGRKTGKSQPTVSRYAHGTLKPPADWLRAAWHILRPGRAA
ncbi:MAG TPA: hypothetical protein VFI34_01380 [Candidatus Limnocylindrales bacterium]|nr:hypothetical protein [Candidatus Limnocylindrales bacterium]